MAKGKGFFGGKKEVTPPEAQIGKQPGADITPVVEDINTKKLEREDKPKVNLNAGFTNKPNESLLSKTKRETGLKGMALVNEWRKRKANGKAN